MTDSVRPCGQCPEAKSGLCALLLSIGFREFRGTIKSNPLRKNESIQSDSPGRDRFVLVARGSAKLRVLRASGAANVIGFLGPGELAHLRVKSEAISSAVSLEAATVCTADFGKVQALGDKHGVVAAHMAHRLSNEVTRLRGRLTLLGVRSAGERLAAFLLDEMDSRRWAVSETEHRLPFSRFDIGEYLMLSPETISRAFTDLVHRGMIRCAGPRRIVKLDHPGWAEVEEVTDVEM